MLFFDRDPMAGQTVHLAFASDSTCAVPLGIAILSLLRVRPAPVPYVFHVLDSGIPIGVQKTIEQLVERAGSTVQFLPVGGRLAELPCGGRFPVAVYHRFLLPELLPADVERVLYLDADLIACRDVSPLFHFDLGGRPLGAPVWQVVGPYEREMGSLLRGFCARMGLPDDGEPYFYSSQLLMDLAALRREGVGEQLIRFAHEADPASLAWPDQDVMNAVLRGRIAVLPCDCNVIPLFADAVRAGDPRSALPRVYDDEELRTAYGDPMLVHYAASKPNVLRGPRDVYDEWFFELWRQSPWRHCLPYVPEGLRRMVSSVPSLALPALALARGLCYCSPTLLRAYGRCLMKLARVAQHR